MTTKELNQHIAQVNGYFVNKILNKDFEVIRAKNYFVDIKIDGEYYFCFYVTKHNFSRMDSLEHPQFIELKFFEGDEKPQVLDILHKIQQDTVTEEKINQLKAELESYEKLRDSKQ